VHALLLIPLLGGGRHAASLAAGLGVTRQAVAQVVATLERDGYVCRVPDPGDGRAKLICLTPSGRAALRTMRASALATEEDYRRQLGAERLAEFRATLLLLLSARNRLDDDPDLELLAGGHVSRHAMRRAPRRAGQAGVAPASGCGR
jgi:DNA-binding MarR family transcriptional regulator